MHPQLRAAAGASEGGGERERNFKPPPPSVSSGSPCCSLSSLKLSVIPFRLVWLYRVGADGLPPISRHDLLETFVIVTGQDSEVGALGGGDGDSDGDEEETSASEVS